MKLEKRILEKYAKIFANKNFEIESFLLLLRKEGFSKIESIQILVYCGNFPLSKAKEVVDKSNAWKDFVARDEEFHDQLENTF